MRSLVFALLLAGCSNPVLEGPDYPVEGPPWIAAGMPATSESIDVRERLLLIGDAGLYLEDDPTLEALGNWSNENLPTTVLFLGDNIYNEGLTEEDRAQAEAIIAQQLDATLARKVFLPGNHDWGMLPSDMNLQAILNQQAFIDDWPRGNAIWLPRDGCMGPVALELAAAGTQGRGIVLVLLDPTPFLNERLRAECPEPQTADEHFGELSELLERHRDEHVVVASHYPMLTGGPHGGLSYGGVAEPIVGFIGWMYGGLLNTYEPKYANWITQMKAVMREYPPLVYAAGHDHSLQVLEGGDVVGVYAVSGAGAPERVTTVTPLAQSYFAHAAPGFMVLDFGLRNGEEVVLLRVVENGVDAPVFEMEVEGPLRH